MRLTSGRHLRGRKKYDRIHAGGISYLTGTRFADATPGPVLRESRFLEIYKSVFGEFSQAAKLSSLRDALHLDQCWQNMVDYFVTDDKALYNCGEIDFTVCDAEICLERLREHFQKTEGTAQIGDLSRKLAELGPVILGSKSSGAFECRLGGDEDPLLKVEIGSGELSVYCTIRNDLGNTLVKILPGKEFEFSEGNAKACLLAGPSPLKLGTRQCKSFAITCDDRALLAGRFVRPGRLVLFEALLRAANGADALFVHRSLFGLCGCSFAPLPEGSRSAA